MLAGNQCFTEHFQYKKVDLWGDNNSNFFLNFELFFTISEGSYPFSSPIFYALIVFFIK